MHLKVNYVYTILDQNSTVDIYNLTKLHNRPVSQMRALLAACSELAVDYDTFPTLLPVHVFGHKNVISFTHILELWCFDTSVTYPNDLESNLL